MRNSVKGLSIHSGSALMLALVILLAGATPAQACMSIPPELHFSPGTTVLVANTQNAEQLDDFATSYLSAGSTSLVRIVGLFDLDGDVGLAAKDALVRSMSAQVYLMTHGIPEGSLRVVLLAGEAPGSANGVVRVLEEPSGSPQTQQPGDPVRVC